MAEFENKEDGKYAQMVTERKRKEEKKNFLLFVHLFGPMNDLPVDLKNFTKSLM